MGIFKTNKVFFASPSLIPVMARDITATFAGEGYEVHSDELISGGYDISITKGGIFKAVLGMKTALKIHIYPNEDTIRMNAGVGIFGQQAIPAIISMFFFWPVLVTQISGIIMQARLDDKAIAVAAETVERESHRLQTPVGDTGSGKFCTRCGKKVEEKAAFCSHCGAKL